MSLTLTAARHTQVQAELGPGQRGSGAGNRTVEAGRSVAAQHSSSWLRSRGRADVARRLAYARWGCR